MRARRGGSLNRPDHVQPCAPNLGPNPTSVVGIVLDIWITFEALPENSSLKIFTLSGRLVKQWSGLTGTHVWRLDTDKGDRAASGIYLFLIKDAQGHERRGKLGVVR